MRIVLIVIALCLLVNISYADSLAKISDNICRGLITDEEKIVALRDHVFNKMKPRVIPLEEANNKSLEELYELGCGWCDHQAVVFCLLAREQGLISRVIFLMTEDMHSSPHTIAEVKLGNRWIVVDVGNNFDYRDERGRLATRADMVADFNIVMSKVDFGNENYWKMFTRNCIQGRTFEP